MAARKDPIMLTHDGETRSIREWSEIVGVGREAIKTRLRRGWPVDRALQKANRGGLKRHKDAAPPPPFLGDPDAWLMQVWTDPRRCGRSFEVAFAMYRAAKEDRWPLSLTELSIEANMHRRSIQRSLPKIEHCGHIRLVYVSPCRTDIILIDKSAPAETAEPALMAAE